MSKYSRILEWETVVKIHTLAYIACTCKQSKPKYAYCRIQETKVVLWCSQDHVKPCFVRPGDLFPELVRRQLWRVIVLLEHDPKAALDGASFLRRTVVPLLQLTNERSLVALLRSLGSFITNHHACQHSPLQLIETRRSVHWRNHSIV